MSGMGTRTLENAFGTPRGLTGRVGGALMARGNAAVEAQVVRLAHPDETDDVLVVGPGPGIGLRAAGERAATALGVEPSAEMRLVARRRCAELVEAGKVQLRHGTAEATGLPDDSVDVALSVNNVQLWADRAVAFAELRRVLRPDGLLLVSTHERLLPGGRERLSAEVSAAGFGEIQTWSWVPPARGTSTAAQLRARRTGERN